MKRVLIACGFLAAGLLSTFALSYLSEQSEAMARALLLLWRPVIYAGTQVLPTSITVPYDPVGHPSLYVLAFLVTAGVFGLVFYGLWRLIRR